MTVADDQSANSIKVETIIVVTPVVSAIPRVGSSIAIVLVADFDIASKTIGKHWANERSDFPITIQIDAVIQHYGNVNEEQVFNVPVFQCAKNAF